MNNLERNQQTNDNTPEKRRSIDDHFEQNAGVKILKGKESYRGGSGFYATKAKNACPNVNDGHSQNHSGKTER